MININSTFELPAQTKFVCKIPLLAHSVKLTVKHIHRTVNIKTISYVLQYFCHSPCLFLANIVYILVSILEVYKSTSSSIQRVETGVKLTTAGAARVVGQKRQVGECLMVEASRKKSPGRVTQKRFNI